ncbi:MAG: LruC domain-containing protein, partial [Bacteroidota bacterium]
STAVTSLFLQLKTVTGFSETIEVPVENTINYTFSGKGGGKMSSLSVNEPDCESGCDSLLTGSGTVMIENGLTYCITDSYSGHISIHDGTLKVCGTFNGTISMGQEEATCKLIITSTGSATISSISMTRNCSLWVFGEGQVTIGSISMIHNSFLQNWGTVLINNNFTHPDVLRNFGNLTINGQYTIGGTACELENLGFLSVNSNWEVSGNVINHGTIEVFGNIYFNGKTVQNSCNIGCHQQVIFNTMEFNSSNGYLYAAMEVTVNEGAKLVLQNQSMISTPVFTMKNTVAGEGSTSVIKCTASGSIIGPQGFLTGAVEMLTPDGTLLSGSYPENFLEGAILNPIADASAYIPTGICNPEGSGQPDVSDSDGDGVPNLLDDFPADSERAFLSWYPSASAFGSLIFEDLWPFQGDYDMNDAVIDYQFRIVTNSWNQVVDIQPKFYLRAAGAALKNGFGFQLDQIIPEVVGSVSGYIYKFGYINLNENGTESSQEHATIIVWDYADNIIHRVGPRSEFNTLADYPAGYSDSVFINIHFAIPQDQILVGSPPYNPFLIKNLDRSIEIHMPDYIPTSLANPVYFGTADDDSKPIEGRYYKTKKNLLWAANITEKYQYTYEYIAILYGYRHFAEWCQYSGNIFPDWYKNLPGYRNEYMIYDITFK